MAIPNGSSPTAVATVSFRLMPSGQVEAECRAPDALMVFHIIGQGTAVLAAEFKRQQAGKMIEVAPAGLLKQLPN